jgi:hypothetical protein
MKRASDFVLIISDNFQSCIILNRLLTTERDILYRAEKTGGVILHLACGLLLKKNQRYQKKSRFCRNSMNGTLIALRQVGLCIKLKTRAFSLAIVFA